MKTKIFLFATLLLVILPVGNACADWLIYHKPAFAGQILDTETKLWIEGAAVVALYYREYPGIGGRGMSVIHIREAVTDKDGRFQLPSYTTMISPWAWEEDVRFIIYKPGYVGVQTDLEAEFSGGKVTYPNLDVPWIHNPELIIRYREPNIVELPPARTQKDRRLAQPAPYGDKNHWKHQQQLIRLIREEYQSLFSVYPADLYAY